MRRFVFSMFGLLFSLSGYAATDLTADSINAAQPTATNKTAAAIDPLTVKVQILLDRAHFSPSEIDGKSGENFQKAIRAYAGAQGLASERRLSRYYDDDRYWDERRVACPRGYDAYRGRCVKNRNVGGP